MRISLLDLRLLCLLKRLLLLLLWLLLNADLRLVYILGFVNLLGLIYLRRVHILRLRFRFVGMLKLRLSRADWLTASIANRLIAIYLLACADFVFRVLALLTLLVYVF